jgi:hypothetical protein
VVTLSVSDARFLVTGAGELVVAPGAVFDFDAEPSILVEVTATDSSDLAATETFTITVEPPAGPRVTPVAFTNLVGYSGQDRPFAAGPAAPVVSPDGLEVTLGNNFWKRAALPEPYVPTATTILTVDVVVGPVTPEIVAIGFDPDNNAFNGNGLRFQLAGTETNAAFVDLRGTGVPTEAGALRFTIDLGALAGVSLPSIVIFADDDRSGNGIGSATFSNVAFVEDAPANAAPRVVGGGIADLEVDENAPLEFSLAFEDTDGDPLSYGFEVSGGDPASAAALAEALAEALAQAGAGSAEVNLVLPQAVAPGVYSVIVRASDGLSTTPDSFTLTVRNVNAAPVAEDVALEPVFARVGAAIEPIALADFAEFFSDPDLDTLTLTAEDLPAGLVFDPVLGVVSGAPTALGAQAFTIRASDPSGLSATLQVALQVDGPAVGDTIVVEAEAFTGLPDATSFYATGTAGASGGALIRMNFNQAGAVETDLAPLGVSPGHYLVSITVYDETDGDSTFTLRIGDQILAQDLSIASTGTFVNPGAPRGAGGQLGNVKTISFASPVLVEADAVLSITGQASGEQLRIDKLSFTRVEAPANGAPTIEGAPAAVVVDENATAVATLVIDDPEDDPVVVTLEGPDAALFAYDATTGALRFLAAPDFEVPADADADGVYQVTVVAADGSNETRRDVAVTVADVNEALALSPGGFAVAENVAAVGTLVVRDEDGGAAQLNAPIFSISGGADAARFEIDPDTGELSFVDAADFEAGQTEFAVEITVTDGALSAVGAVAVTLTDVNESLSLAQTAFALVENGTGGFALAARDEDGGTGQLVAPSFAIVGGADAARFSIDPATGALSFVTPPDFEAPADADGDNLYEVEVAITDGAVTGVQMVTVTVEDDAEEPIVIQAEDATRVTVTDVGAPDAQGANVTREVNAGAPDAFGNHRAGAVDGAYIDFGTDAGDAISFAIDVPLAGVYTAAIRYANGATTPNSGDRPLLLAVNGGPETLVSFPRTQQEGLADWEAWTELQVSVTLQAGSNTLRLEIPTAAEGGQPNGPNIDQIRFTFEAPLVDDSADADGDLALAPVAAQVEAAFLGAVQFRLTGVDADVTGFEASIDAGETFAPVAVTPDGPGAYLVTIDLTSYDSAAAGLVEIRVTDAAGNTAVAQGSVAIVYPDDTPEPFLVEIQAETFAVFDTDGVTGAGLTQARVPGNAEILNDPVRDANGDGLWDGFTGAGYMDMGGQVGDAVGFTVDAPAAGDYTFTFRYANGGAGANGPRPMALTVNGEPAGTPQFAGTGVGGWNVWAEETVTVTLESGANLIRLANTIANGPNLDRVIVASVEAPADDTADADGDLAIAAVDLADPDAAVFAISGVDADVETVEITVNGGPRQSVTPDGAGRITLDLGGLAPGAVVVTVIVTDGAGNEAAAGVTATLAPEVLEPFALTIQAEAFTILDLTGTTPETGLTVVRDAANPEPVTPERGPDGLWDDFTGTGYLDMGSNVGDAAAFSFEAPADGVYTLTFRYANGGGDGAARPMLLSLDGAAIGTIGFAHTVTFDTWTDVSVEVALTAGNRTFTIANTVANGPNIDRVSITADLAAGPDVSEPGPRETIRINFQDGAAPEAPGYHVDTFQGFGDRGNGQVYGWVTEASAIDADGTTNTPIDGALYPAVAINERTGGVFDSYDPRLTGYAHFDLGAAYPSGPGNRVAWEIELDDGWYEVTVAVGDTGGPNDSVNRLRIEGELSSSFTPTDLYKTELVTKLVKVEDGRLTLTAQDGVITEIQYLEIRPLPDLTPADGREAPADYAFFTDPRAVAQEGSEIFSVSLEPDEGFASGVDPAADIFLGVAVVEGRGGVLLESLSDGSFKLFETLTGAEVAFSANTTAGADSVTISPTSPLKPFTSYTLVVDGARDRGANGDPDAPTREFQKLTTTFLTGPAREVEAREVAFNDVVEINGAADGAFGFTSVEVSPDGQHLYVATIGGQIKRWDLDPEDGSIVKDSLVTFTPGGDFNVGGERRGIIGLTFDPTDPDVIWITDNHPIPISGRDNGVPDFSGRVSKVTLGAGGDLASATVETYIKGLPRSNGDHVTNSLEFRLNPAYDPDTNPDVPQHLLYLIQGSNSAMGEADSAWGFRPERLLSAAVMEIDPTREAPAGGFDVTTEPLPADGLNRRFADLDGDLKNGGIAITSGEHAGQFLHFDASGVASVREGALATSALVKEFYNPFAADAVLSVFATGQRNAYDLVWHSNGYLYVPTNGSAAGGNVPNDPDTAANEGINNVGLQQDYLFRVEQGGYYGHPNPLRDEFVMNGGNPTAGADPNQVGNYPVGTQPDPNYRVDSAYGLGNNRSPNGVIEYASDLFGSSLKGAVLFTEYSGGDDVRAVTLDADGFVTGDFVLRDPQGNIITYVDPLDIIENPATGQLYLVTLNRGNGQSQIIRLDPAPGGAVGDTTADVGGDLSIVAVDLTDPAAAVFLIAGLDADIATARVSFDGGATEQTVPAANGQLTLDLSALGLGTKTILLRVVDGAGNVAEASRGFTLVEEGEEPVDGLVSLVTIQAEDDTPGDGTSVSVATGGGAQIQIRTAANPESPAGPALVNGLRPGAVGLDGNTDNLDGTPGGYADFGSTNVDFITFSFTVAAGQAGPAVLRFRYANGDNPADADGGVRPLAVEVNGVLITTAPFAPTTGATPDERLQTWEIQEVAATLVAGVNTVTLRATQNTGPNVDQLEVLVPASPDAPYAFYEAETAQLIGGPVVVQDSLDDRNAEGTGFVDFVGATTQSIAWTVTVTEAGFYEVGVRYALAATKAARPATLTVDGGQAQVLPFEPFSNAAENEWRFEITTVQLQAGVNVITLTAPNANGANIDQLRVSTSPVSAPFAPDYALVDEAGLRLELEQTADNSTRTLSAQTVEFFLTVAADGVYALDVASNPGAPNGGGLTFFLNGVQVGQTGFPGAGEAGETTVYVDLVSGQQYALRVVSSAPGASAIDYLDLRPAPGDPDAEIAIESLDPAYYDNRLHFSWLDDNSGSNPDRAFKEDATVRISNTGSEPLQFLEAVLAGPFELADPDVFDGLTLAPGASIEVEVLFDRSAYVAGGNLVSGVFEGELRLRTNDADTPVATIDLAGFWQARDEGGWEPNINEVWEVFGFGTRVAGVPLIDSQPSPLDNRDIYEAINPLEVLSPYWRLADGVTTARITQIAAFHGDGGATVGIHAPGDKDQHFIFSNHAGDNNQSILPLLGNGNFATATFTRATVPDAWAGNDIFGIEVANFSTDPRLNTQNGPGTVPEGTQRGHFTRMFVALDEDGNVIPNVYLGIQDYTGINYDYNDNMFVIEGVTPVGFGGTLAIAGLDDAAADDRLVFTSIDTPNSSGASNAIGGQQFRNEAALTLSNDGIIPVAITGMTLGGASPGSFQIVGAPPTSIPAGGSVQVTVRFVGTDPAADGAAVLHEATLTVQSDAFGAGTTVIQLAGLAQNQSENGEEPTVAQIVEAFGYGTDVAQGALANGGAVETVGDEVLMPYLVRLDVSQPIEIIQLAAFLQQTNVARLSLHGLDSAETTELFAQDDQQGQTVLPDGHVPGPGNTGSVARASFVREAPFGLYVAVDGRPTFASWTDPEANRIDPNFGQLVGAEQGHLIRFFQAKDAAGNVIAGTYIAIQDYPGAGNYDYNDHMFLVRNVRPHVLTPLEDADADGVNDALQTDTDSDGQVDFFDADSTPTPVQTPFNPTAAPWLVDADGITILGTAYDQGGQGVAYNDAPGLQGGTNGGRTGSDVEVTPGGAIGWIANGEWLEYTIDVETAGVHTLSFLTATGGAGRAITASFEKGGVTYVTALTPVANTGSYLNFQPGAPLSVTLQEGVQVLRVTFTGGALDLQSLTIAPPAPVQAPFGGAPRTFTDGSITVLANLFDEGGQGIAYNDDPGLDGGNTAFRPGRDVEFVGAQNDIGFVQAGEWVEYTITVPAAGTYDFSVLAKTPVSGASVTLSIAGGPALGVAALADGHPGGSDFGAAPFAASAAVPVTLAAGTQTIRLTFAGPPASNGYVLDLRSFTLTASEPANTPPAAAGIPDQTGEEGDPFSLDVSAAFSDADGDSLSFAATGLPPGVAISAAGVISGAPTAPGVYTVTVTASDGEASASTSFALAVAVEPEAPAQSPFGGAPRGFANGALTVTANLFDEGGQGVAYNDDPGLDGGNTAFRPGRDVEFVGAQNDIGFVQSGEWLEYTIDAPQAGTYAFSVVAKTPVTGATVTLSVSDGPALGTIALADGHPGGSNFGSAPFATSAAVPVTLSAGVQTLRLTLAGPAASNGYVLDLRSFTLQTLDQQAPFNAATTPWLVGDDGLSLQAGLFDEGGQGVAYNDVDAPNGSGARGTGVDIVPANGAIGWISDGEWVEYTIAVAEAGSYDLVFQSALGSATGLERSITATFAANGAVYETATVATPRTGAWTAFQPTEPVSVDLQAGVQVLRLTFAGGAQDLASFALTPSAGIAAAAFAAAAEPAAARPDEIPDLDGLVGQAGVTRFAQPDADAWTYVAFDAPIEDAVVVMGPLSREDAAPATLRVRNVTSEGFEFQLDAWDYLDGAHGAETVSWLAVKSGVHTLANGLTVAAGVGAAGATPAAIGFGTHTSAC